MMYKVPPGKQSGMIIFLIGPLSGCILCGLLVVVAHQLTAHHTMGFIGIFMLIAVAIFYCFFITILAALLTRKVSTGSLVGFLIPLFCIISMFVVNSVQTMPNASFSDYVSLASFLSYFVQLIAVWCFINIALGTVGGFIGSFIGNVMARARYRHEIPKW